QSMPHSSAVLFGRFMLSSRPSLRQKALGIAPFRSRCWKYWLLMSTNPPSLDDLWGSAPSSHRSFEPALIRNLPEAVQRYLGHAIAPGTPLASAFRLRMHGEIKLKG